MIEPTWGVLRRTYSHDLAVQNEVVLAVRGIAYEKPTIYTSALDAGLRMLNHVSTSKLSVALLTQEKRQTLGRYPASFVELPESLEVNSRCQGS
jgi:hypothetical protein